MVCNAMCPPRRRVPAVPARSLAVVSQGVSGDGLWAPHRRALTLGLVLTVTFIASEALAVVTVMPLVAHDLKGLELYGWVFTSFQLASLVGIVVAGRDADRHGPARPYVAGLVLFSAGLLVAGLAPSMWVLVGGRCLQGLGAGAIPAVAYVAIGRSLREVQRARMMAVLSTAWVVPGIVGPGVAAAVAHLAGWRWVFLGLIPLVAVAGPIAVPALLRLGRPDAVPADEHRVADAVRTAVGAALILAALGSRDLLVGLGLAALAAVVGLAPCGACSRPGTLRGARGLPATILSRGLLTFAFFGADAYVTLTITTVRHHGTLMAGAVVTASTLAWTAGSWLQAQLNLQWEGCPSGARRAAADPGRDSGHGLATPSRRARVGGLRGVVGRRVRHGPGYAPLSLMMLRAPRRPDGRDGPRRR